MKIKKKIYEKNEFIILDELGKYRIYNNSLESNIMITIFGKQYKVDVSIQYLEEKEEEWELSEQLIDYAKKFLNGINSYLEKATYEIEQYYNTTIREEAEEGFCQYIEIEDSNSLSLFLTPYVLRITRFDEKLSMIQLIFQCDWYEDEFMVKYDKDCNIKEVGPLW